MSNIMTRRQFTAAVAAAAVAGCTDTDEGEDTVEPETVEETTEQAETTEETTEQNTVDETAEQTTEEATQASSVSIEILDHGWEVLETYDSDAVDDQRGVVGTVKNTGDVTVSVFVNVQFYRDGTQITDFTDGTSHLDPGQEFRFEAPYIEDPDVTSYEVDAEAHEEL
jgi:hypothetical protein